MSGNDEGKRGLGPPEFILDEQGKDIRVSSKRKLSDYLSRRTRGGSETYTPPLQGAGDYTYMPPRPNTYPIEPGYSETGAGPETRLPGQFASGEDLERLSGNPALRSAVSIQPSARENSTAPNGNEVNVNPETREIVQASVLSQNRFTSGDKFTAKSYREAAPRKPTGETPRPNDGSVFEEMRQRAIETMLRAAGGSAGPGSSVEGLDSAGDLKVTTDRIGFKASSLLLPFRGVDEGEAKVVSSAGLRVGANREKYIAPGGGLDGLDNPNTDTIYDGKFGQDQPGDTAETQPAQYNDRSFGQLNSFLQQFSGRGTLSAVPLALLAYGALFVGVALVSLIISVIVNRLPRPNPEISPLPLGAERGGRFGNYLFRQDTDANGFLDVLRNFGGTVAKTMGLMQPYESPFDSVAGDFFAYFFAALEGALSITGIDVQPGTGVTGGAVVDSAASIAINFGTSPGYYLVLIREIARDLYYMSETLTSKSESSIFGILDAFRELKLIRFVDTCARLGIVNGVARDADGSVDPDSPGSPAPGAPLPTPSGLANNYFQTAQLRVSRSREVEGSKRLAWSHISLGYTRAELVTKQSLRAYANYPINNGKETGATALRRLRARKVFSDSGRISPEDREHHERLLDAEYMPFYFHDVRTNEILSFHAFLSALSDSFTANYTATDGFGRMDPIQTYKNTTRSISFSFTVVATSPEDHDNMWYSINKLVNMLYPQWSQGEDVSNDDSKFTQPFSQTVAASPLIRVRIGDVIHSNYSRFALGRLFGLDQEDAKLAGNSLETPDNGPPDANIATIASAMQGAPALLNEPSSDNDLNKNSQVGVGNDLISVIAGNISAKISPLPCTVWSGKYRVYKSFADALARKGGKRYEVESYSVGKIAGYSEKETIRGDTSYVVVELDKAVPTSDGDSYTHIVAEASQVSVYTSVSSASTVLSSQNTTQQNVAAFLSPGTGPDNGNPIVRSFEQGSGGRGLAGFISQLGVEYGNTETTWSTARGSRAPNMVTLSVTFLPIHDIPMGLASDGTARSVAYPVGGITRLMHMPDAVQRDTDDASLITKTIINKQ